MLAHVIGHFVYRFGYLSGGFSSKSKVCSLTETECIRSPSTWLWIPLPKTKNSILCSIRSENYASGFFAGTQEKDEVTEKKCQHKMDNCISTEKAWEINRKNAIYAHLRQLLARSLDRKCWRDKISSLSFASSLWCNCLSHRVGTHDTDTIKLGTSESRRRSQTKSLTICLQIPEELVAQRCRFAYQPIHVNGL